MKSIPMKINKDLIVYYVIINAFTQINWSETSDVFLAGFLKNL